MRNQKIFYTPATSESLTGAAQQKLHLNVSLTGKIRGSDRGFEIRRLPRFDS